MSDAPAEKTPAQIELEDSMRSIRALGENLDGVESPEERAAGEAPTPDAESSS
jgi:hypothetical protein